MLIRFSERFALPVEEVFRYFASPAEWPRLYGFAGARDLGSGWFAVGIKKFPFSLVAKATLVEPNQRVRWVFRGFWRGSGEVRFTASSGSLLVEGYEDISVRWLSFLSPVAERFFLESRFRAIWQLGWRRLRKLEDAARAGFQEPDPDAVPRHDR
jgi:hypothetical protein